MTVRVIREPSISGTTIGIVLVDDRFFCWCLEDEIRERKGQPVHAWKVPGETAIPQGRYRLALTHSPRFGRVLPEVLNVTGFTGIRIHPGNTHGDSEGCLLLGKSRGPATVLQSRAACQEFESALAGSLERGEPAWLLIENPLSWAA